MKNGLLAWHENDVIKSCREIKGYDRCNNCMSFPCDRIKDACEPQK